MATENHHAEQVNHGTKQVLLHSYGSLLSYWGYFLYWTSQTTHLPHLWDDLACCQGSWHWTTQAGRSRLFAALAILIFSMCLAVRSVRKCKYVVYVVFTVHIETHLCIYIYIYTYTHQTCRYMYVYYLYMHMWLSQYIYVYILFSQYIYVYMIEYDICVCVS